MTIQPSLKRPRKPQKQENTSTGSSISAHENKNAINYIDTVPNIMSSLLSATTPRNEIESTGQVSQAQEPFNSQLIPGHTESSRKDSISESLEKSRSKRKKVF